MQSSTDRRTASSNYVHEHQCRHNIWSPVHNSTADSEKNELTVRQEQRPDVTCFEQWFATLLWVNTPFICPKGKKIRDCPRASTSQCHPPCASGNLSDKLSNQSDVAEKGCFAGRAPNFNLCVGLGASTKFARTLLKQTAILCPLFKVSVGVVALALVLCRPYSFWVPYHMTVTTRTLVE